MCNGVKALHDFIAFAEYWTGGWFGEEFIWKGDVMMSYKTRPIHKTETKDKQMKHPVEAMTFFFWVTLIIGLVMIGVNLSFFSDRNLGLMVGIGFVVGSIVIYFLGKYMGVMRKKEEG